MTKPQPLWGAGGEGVGEALIRISRGKLKNSVDLALKSELSISISLLSSRGKVKNSIDSALKSEHNVTLK